MGSYICSDLHLYHTNIIKYCNRPYEPNTEGTLKMNEDILKNIDALPDDATLWNLGDVFFGKLAAKLEFDELQAVVSRMKGKGRTLKLILGNHDREVRRYLKAAKPYVNAVSFFQDLGFDMVYDHPILIESKTSATNIILSHEPVLIPIGTPGFINYYGHTHDKSVDVWDGLFGDTRIERCAYKNVCIDANWGCWPLGFGRY